MFFINSVDKKIKKLCQELEKDFGAEVICGARIKGSDTDTILVSIKRSFNKNESRSFYNQPIGLIEISGERVRFIPLNRRDFLLRSVFKILIIIISIFGVKGLFKSKKKWNAE